jgi:hypothetical protein
VAGAVVKPQSIYRLVRDAVDGDVWVSDPDVVLSAGPSDGRPASKADPPYEPPRLRLGFAPPPVDVPLAWEGDDS